MKLREATRDGGHLRRDLLLLALVNIGASLLTYVPLTAEPHGPPSFGFSGVSLDNIYRYWDGPLYLVVAKTFYNTSDPAMSAFQHLPPLYYAAHFPAYPLFIRALSYLFGYPGGMLAASILLSTLALFVFYFLVRDFGYTRSPLFLGLVFVFLPARWLIYHSVGASEPLYLLAFLGFIYLYKKRKFWAAGLVGGLAVLTRSPGILILLSYVLVTLLETKAWRDWRALWKVAWERLPPMLPFLVVPLLLFAWYYRQYGDFFAYFHSGDNIHLTIMPFSSIWPSILGNWTEGAIWMYLLNGLGILFLRRQGYHDLAIFAAAFYIPLIFVAHHDISRYMLPIFPLSLLIAYEGIINTREFRLALAVIIPAVYIYVWSGLRTNLAPPEGWALLESYLNR